MSPTAITLAVIFALISLQMIMSFLQLRRYQKAVQLMRGSGILGIGQRRGRIKPGEILILSYNRHSDKVVACKSMRGYSALARFEDRTAYIGMTLAEARETGVARDAKELKGYRKKHPYDPKVLSKKKGALIQAVEAIELRLRREAEEAELD